MKKVTKKSESGDITFEQRKLLIKLVVQAQSELLSPKPQNREYAIKGLAIVLSILCK